MAKIPLAQEIDHVDNFLAIQKIRYEDSLNYEIIKNRKDYTPEVQKLIIQPLVENAIYHGIKKKEVWVSFPFR